MRHIYQTRTSLRKLLSSPIFRALIALFFVVSLGVIFNADGAFFKWGTHRDMLRQLSVFGILACGMTMVIISGGIDLSVGSILGFTAVLFALFSLRLGLPAWLVIPLCLASGTLCGLVSGGLVARFGLQPFIATLAMMVIARGLAKYTSGGQKISSAVLGPDGNYHYRGVPPVFTFISSKVFGQNVAVVTILFFICALMCGLLLSRLRWGRYIYAVGGNEEAARLSGVPIVATKLLVYGLSGFFCAIAGLSQAAQELQGDPEAGTSYELTTIAIVVIGGTSLLGGRGGMALTVIGALTIGCLDKILSINAVGEASRLILTGAIVVGAVLFQKSRK